MTITLSIVVPCYNESNGLNAFAEKMLPAAKKAAGNAFEIIFVDDGSQDDSWKIITNLSAKHSHIKGIKLARNHGQPRAVTAGLEKCRGDYALIIDADLQDPPELTEKMLKKAQEGFDVIHGKRISRQGESWFKKFTASLYYKILNFFSHIDIPCDAGDFKLISRRVIDTLNDMPERDRYLRGMISWAGGKQTTFEYERHARHQGETNYNFLKLFRIAMDGLIGFSTAPLKLMVAISIFTVLIALILSCYVLGSFLLGKAVTGWSSLALIMTFFFSIQFICMSVLGAYVERIYIQVKNRPMLVIEDETT